MRNFQAKVLLIVATMYLAAGCARIQSQVMPGTDFRQYKTVYLEPLEVDEFNLAPAIAWELSDMGLKVVGQSAPADPGVSDMLVRFNYTGGWDIQRYLRGFNVQMTDARSKALLASVSYFKLGLFVSQSSRMEDAFNDLRYKLGFPPTKQFE